MLIGVTSKGGGHQGVAGVRVKAKRDAPNGGVAAVCNHQALSGIRRVQCNAKGHVGDAQGGSRQAVRVTVPITPAPHNDFGIASCGVNLLNTSSGNFVAQDGTQRSDSALRGLASTAGQEVTYTCTPPGSGRRIAYSS